MTSALRLLCHFGPLAHTQQQLRGRSLLIVPPLETCCLHSYNFTNSKYYCESNGAKKWGL